jgi:nucleoside-diphosphate-sugar epimerase
VKQGEIHMANILIAGCGDVGCLLGTELTKQGHKVFGLRRNIGALPECIIPIEANLASTINDLPKKVDYVFYMASAGKFKDSAYYQAYVSGLKNLLKAIKDQNIKRFFFISSSSVFGQSKGELVSESSETHDTSFSTKRILEGEAITLESHFPSTVVRFGGIYGPGRTHLIDLVRAGKAHCMEDVWSNRIHSADCAGMLSHLFNLNEKNPDSLESLYVGVDNQPSLACEVYEWLAEELRMPEVEHKEASENARTMRSNKRISNAKIRATGYKFKYPTYKEGYLDLI